MTDASEIGVEPEGSAPSAPLEEWREVSGTDGFYEVSNLGRARSWAKCGPSRARRSEPKYLRLTPNHAGYPIISLPDGRKYFVHRLVMEAFVGPCPEGLQVRHLDGDPLNAAVENLRYGTQKENEADKLIHGRDIRGEKCGISRLTLEDVIEIRQGASAQEVAARLNVSISTVYAARCGRSWWWVSDPPPIQGRRPSFKVGASHPRSRLNGNVVLRMRFEGLSPEDAAAECGASVSGAVKAKRGDTWTHLPMPEKE